MAIKKLKIHELIQDDRNLNNGTERGKELIKTSVGRFGAARSILIDKNNRIIAGITCSFEYIGGNALGTRRTREKKKKRLTTRPKQENATGVISK